MGIKIKLRGSASPREVKSKVHLTSAWRFVVLIQSGQTKAFFSHKERKGRKEDKKIKIAVRRVLIGDKKNSLRSLCPLWPKQSNLKPQTDGTSFKSHAELRRRGGFEDGDKNKTPRLRISA